MADRVARGVILPGEDLVHQNELRGVAYLGRRPDAALQQRNTEKMEVFGTDEVPVDGIVGRPGQA